MEKVAVAIMGCSKKEVHKVIDLSNKVKTKLYENVAKYPTPPVTKEAFEAQLKLASDAQGLVKTGSEEEIANRDLQVGLLFGMLDKNLLYVNSLFKGNKTDLLLSGFEVSDISIPHPIPNPVILDRAVKGKTINSVKIYIKSGEATTTGKRERLTYDVWVLKVGVEGAKHEIAFTTTNRHKLILIDFNRKDDLDIYVTARNTAGMSGPSGHATIVVN